jgi:hypothetical protein
MAKARTLALRADAGNPVPDMTAGGRLENRCKTRGVGIEPRILR